MSGPKHNPFRFADPAAIRVTGGAFPALKVTIGAETLEARAKAPGRKSQNEALAYLTARLLDLPVLEAWLAPAADGLCFATRKEALETLKAAGIGYADPFWRAAVAAPWFATAFVFDTLIGNYDRVLSNLAFRPQAPGGAFVLIDHDKAFFHDGWTPDELAATQTMPGRNNLARFAPLMDGAAKAAILKTAQAWQRRLQGTGFGILGQLGDMGLMAGPDLAAATAFLSHRAASLTPLVYALLHPPQKTEPTLE